LRPIATIFDGGGGAPGDPKGILFTLRF